MICRNASVLALHLWPTIFARSPFRLQNICRNGVPPLSCTTTPLIFGEIKVRSRAGYGGVSAAWSVAVVAAAAAVSAAARSLCRRFLNQLLTCTLVRPVISASCRFCRGDGYGLCAYLSSTINTVSYLPVVRSRTFYRLNKCVFSFLRYDTIRDAILTCARKPTCQLNLPHGTDN